MIFSDGEWKVLRGIWAQGASTTARDVLDLIGDETGWSYSTVRTLLARLVEKGALAVARQDQVLIYEPLVSEGDARSDAVQHLVDKAFDGTVGSLLLHLVSDELDADDRAQLRRLLDDAEAG